MVSRVLTSQIAFTPDGHQIVHFTPRGTINTFAVTRFFDATPLGAK